MAQHWWHGMEGTQGPSPAAAQQHLNCCPPLVPTRAEVFGCPQGQLTPNVTMSKDRASTPTTAVHGCRDVPLGTPQPPVLGSWSRAQGSVPNPDALFPPIHGDRVTPAAGSPSPPSHPSHQLTGQELPSCTPSGPSPSRGDRGTGTTLPLSPTSGDRDGKPPG